ncbi:hypothetical protein ACWEPC_06685 [Nonomuraea sp. NPDC004297]
MRHGGGGDGFLALQVSGAQRAGGVGKLATQPISLNRGVGSGLRGDLAGLLGHGGRGNGLLAPLLFGGQCLAETVGLLGVRRGGAAGLVAFLLGFPGPGFLFPQLAAEVGELVLPIAGPAVPVGVPLTNVTPAAI